jgi:hypothetical protein
VPEPRFVDAFTAGVLRRAAPICGTRCELPAAIRSGSNGSLAGRPRAAAGLPPYWFQESDYARCRVGRQISPAVIALSDVCSRDSIEASKSERAV